MPKLISLYIRNIAIGFAISLAFVAALLGFNVANLGHLIAHSDIGYVAVALLVVFNTVVFASVQFAIAVMSMAEEEGGQGGLRDPLLVPVSVPMPVPVRVQKRR